MAVLLAATSLIIGLGPLVSNRPQLFIGLGIALALGYWVTGQGLGELLTFGGTDPNNGPIIALIGLSVLPLRAGPGQRTQPCGPTDVPPSTAAILGVLGLVVVPLAVAVTPAGGQALAPGPSQPTRSSVTAVAMASNPAPCPACRCQAPPARRTHPKVGGGRPMNMSAMAGLNVTDPHWKYTGPPLPAAEVNELTVSSDEQDKGHTMQTPDCTAPPSAQQVLGATQYVQAVSAAVAKYKNLSVAEADGYIPITDDQLPGGPLPELPVHEPAATS